MTNRLIFTLGWAGGDAAHEVPLGITMLFGIGAVAVMAFENGSCDFGTASTASIASIFNVGPGLGGVGPIENYGWMTNSSKLLLSMWMLLGRLELYAVLILFLPLTWRQ